MAMVLETHVSRFIPDPLGDEEDIVRSWVEFTTRLHDPKGFATQSIFPKKPRPVNTSAEKRRFIPLAVRESGRCTFESQGPSGVMTACEGVPIEAQGARAPGSGRRHSIYSPDQRLA
jgi:hypothetical protein